MKHASVLAVFVVWSGSINGSDIPMAAQEWPLVNPSCGAPWDKSPGSCITGAGALREIPTCPRCAVLYDEAMTVREEFLGKQAA